MTKLLHMKPNCNQQRTFPTQFKSDDRCLRPEKNALAIDNG